MDYSLEKIFIGIDKIMEKKINLQVFKKNGFELWIHNMSNRWNPNH